MSPPRLSDDMVLKFLQLYKREVCLWETNHVHYKDRTTRIFAVRRIVQEMNLEGFGEQECKIKIKNLRSQYCKELGKIRNSERNGGSIHVPSLFWFGLADEFLRDKVQIDDYFQRKRGNAVKPDELFLIQNDSIEIESDNEVKPLFIATGSPENSIEITPSVPKRIRLETVETPVEDSVLQSETPSTSIAKGDGLTEFDLWAQSIALQLNQMDIQRALRLQFKLQCLVTKERMRYLAKKRQQKVPSEASPLRFHKAAVPSPTLSHESQDDYIEDIF
ncbi:uncharacterized protein [Periplaneta americana]|uniref:uncharacterized protein n=1 Tax=Periplaneta americana TaxID=6978 RepID=UPI0037E8F151